MPLQRARAAVLALAIASTGGCLAAAGAGLGAGIYMSDRGAESLVAKPIDQVYTASQEVFREMGMTEQEATSEQSASKDARQLSGKRGDKTVRVNLRTEGQGTRVEVIASEDMVVWDKDLAREVLGEIVKKTK
jgi:L-lactate utilization protein LutC